MAAHNKPLCIRMPAYRKAPQDACIRAKLLAGWHTEVRLNDLKCISPVTGHEHCLLTVEADEGSELFEVAGRFRYGI